MILTSQIVLCAKSPIPESAFIAIRTLRRSSASVSYGGILNVLEQVAAVGRRSADPLWDLVNWSVRAAKPPAGKCVLLGQNRKNRWRPFGPILRSKFRSQRMWGCSCDTNRSECLLKGHLNRKKNRLPRGTSEARTGRPLLGQVAAVAPVW